MEGLFSKVRLQYMFRVRLALLRRPTQKMLWAWRKGMAERNIVEGIEMYWGFFFQYFGHILGGGGGPTPRRSRPPGICKTYYSYATNMKLIRNHDLYVCCHNEMTDFFGGAFFGHVFSPKGWPKNPPKWVCLAGKILVSLPPFFHPIWDHPDAHIRQNSKGDREL